MLQTLKHLPPWWTSWQSIMTLPDAIEIVSPSVQWDSIDLEGCDGLGGPLQKSFMEVLLSITTQQGTLNVDRCSGSASCSFGSALGLLDLFCLWPHCAVPWHCVSLQTCFMPCYQTSSRSFKSPTRRVDCSNSMMPRIWPIRSQSIPRHCMCLNHWRSAFNAYNLCNTQDDFVLKPICIYTIRIYTYIYVYIYINTRILACW